MCKLHELLIFESLSQKIVGDRRIAAGIQIVLIQDLQGDLACSSASGHWESKAAQS